MNDTEQSVGARERKVQFEMFFTLPDFSDISLRDYQETMQRPFFSLSKRRRVKPIEYISPDKSVSVHVSANPEYGMATIWDADIMIYLASHLNELRDRGANELSTVVRFQPGDLLKRICWGTSGRAYERLVNALDRLQATTIKTNLRASSKTRETTFSWIDSYTHLVDERTQRSLGMEITLSKWFFDGVMEKRNVLSISPLYFEITSGLGKWLYRAARKHAGGHGPEGFTIGFETLHQKSGSESTFPVFKKMLLELARINELPDINLEVLNEKAGVPKLKMVMRKHLLNRKNSETYSDPISASHDLEEKVSPSELINDTIKKMRASQNIGTERNGIKKGNLTGKKRAKDILDSEIFTAIKVDFPEWDIDELMRRFDTFLGANPLELPRNYSKRFYGFVKEHNHRNRYKL